MESVQATDKEVEEIENQVCKKQKEETVKKCSIVLFGIPLVAGDRLLKLKRVLKKTLSEPGSDFLDFYPVDTEGKTKGYCFIKYESNETAKLAVLLLDNRAFDSRHTFSALPLVAFDSIQKPSTTFEPPKFPPLVDVGNLWSWVLNNDCLDQFAVLFGSPFGKDSRNANIRVYWNGHSFKEPTLDCEIQISSKNVVFHWSPEGSYLACAQKNSVDLYGGPEFKKAKSFEHKDVDYIDFSPKESFLVSYSSKVKSIDDNCLRIFDVFTGELKKCISWPSKQKSLVETNESNDWPFIKWSSDESYFAFARTSQNSLAVFQSNDFSLCDSKEILMEGLVSFEWSPSKQTIAYYCEQKTNSSLFAELGIIEIPSRKKLRSHRILVFVSAAKLFWQKSGDYLAVYTERYSRAKKIVNKDTSKEENRLRNITFNLEIFDCTESNIPVIALQFKEPCCDVGWEPRGSKFCVLIGSGNKVKPIIYQLEKGKTAPLEISSINCGPFHSILWAPQGGWLSVYGYTSISFINASGSEAMSSRTVNHERMNLACWDPTGRYFVTCSTGMETESGAYRIHNFQGRLLHRENSEMALMFFKWRPRPPSALSKQQTDEIQKNMKQLCLKFEEDDRLEQMAIFNKQNSHHREAMEIFLTIRERNRELFEQEHDERVKLRNEFDSDLITNEDLVDEVITVPLETKEEKIDIKTE